MKAMLFIISFLTLYSAPFFYEEWETNRRIRSVSIYDPTESEALAMTKDQCPNGGEISSDKPNHFTFICSEDLLESTWWKMEHQVAYNNCPFGAIIDYRNPDNIKITC